MPNAASLAEEIQSQLGIEAELIKDRGGVFDVNVDGEVIFSKHAQGDRFPETGEVIELIKGLS